MKTQKEMRQYISYLKTEIARLDAEKFPFIAGELCKALRETRAALSLARAAQ